MQGVLTQLRQVSLTHDAQTISGINTGSIQTSKINDVSFADSPIYSIDQYFDNKHTDKHSVYQYYLKEANALIILNQVLREGKNKLGELYSYRSLVRGLPQVQSQEQANKIEIYQATFNILKPEIEKMMKFMEFRDWMVQTVSGVFSTILQEVDGKDVFLSPDMYNAIAMVMDLFVVIDTMKNFKSSMNNDLSMYKRAQSFLPKAQVDDDVTNNNHKLYLFLGQQDQFTFELKKQLNMVNGSDEVIQDVLNHSADCIENLKFLLPETKHSYLKAIALGLLLLDNDGDDKDITKRKKFKLERLGKLIKATPIVPLFGDSPIILSKIFAKAPHIGQGKWELCEMEDKRILAKSYNIIHCIDQIKAESMEYVANFSKTMSSLNAIYVKEGKHQEEYCISIYNMVLHGVQLLSNYTTKVLEQSAFKYNFPAIASEEGIPENALLYELAVKYNYNSNEKRALVELLGIIKNLSSLLYNIPQNNLEAIKNSVYFEVQSFMQLHLTEFISHAAKKKRSILSILKIIQDIAIDCEVDDAEKSQSKKKLQADKIREDPISHSQMYFLRAYLDFAFNEKTKGMKGSLLSGKDFKDNQVLEVYKFLNSSFYHSYLLDLKNTVTKCSDLSDLWFKEFYLEMTKQVQFPISMSLPWILTESMFENEDSVKRNILIPFDIYNDAARKTLYDLKCQYIYDEIVAEVNLCFDQFIFKISQRIFQQYKKAASSIVISSDLATPVQISIFDSILGQTQYQLLGRSINIQFSIGQMINENLKKSIDTAICKFEASDLTSVIELEKLLQTAKMTHELFSKHIQLDAFDDILSEIDETLSLNCVGGRIMNHIVQELLDDFIPNMAYNSVTCRFIRGLDKYVDSLPRVAFNKGPAMYTFGGKNENAIFNEYLSNFKGYVGEPHFKAIVKLVGNNSLTFIVDEVTSHVTTLVNHTMTAYIDVIQKGIPDGMILPLVEYGAAGAFEYFSAHLKPLITYGDLKPEILQAFREIGNSIMFIKTLQETSDLFWRKVQLLPLYGNNFVKDSISQAIKQVETVGKSLAILADGIENPTSLQCNNNLLTDFLVSLKTRLLDLNVGWKGEKDGQLENPRTFFKIWSALQFAICLPPPNSNEIVNHWNNREIFGDGLQYAGCTCIHLLSQVSLFTAYDFNNHILSVNKLEKKQVATQQSNIQGYSGVFDINASPHMGPTVLYLENASFISNLNEEIFDFLANKNL